MARTILNPPTATSDKLVEITEFRNSSRYSISGSQTGVLWTPGTFAKQKSAAESFLVLEAMIPATVAWSDQCGVYIRLTSETLTTDGPMHEGVHYGGVDNSYTWAKFIYKAHRIVENISAGTYTVECGWNSRNGTNQKPFENVNPNGTDDSRDFQMGSRCWVWEIAY